MNDKVKPLWEKMAELQEYQLTYINRLSLAVRQFAATTGRASDKFAVIAPLLPNSAKADDFQAELKLMVLQADNLAEALNDFAQTDIQKNLLVSEIAHAQIGTSDHK